MLDKAKAHLAVWNAAYIRGSLYAIISALSDFLSRTELSPDKLAEMTLFSWIRIALFAILAAAIAIRAFIDSSVGEIKQKQSTGNTAVFTKQLG